MKNYKTTICGIACLGLAAIFICFGISAPVGNALIPVGMGFLMAKDYDTTGIGTEATKQATEKAPDEQ